MLHSANIVIRAHSMFVLSYRFSRQYSPSLYIGAATVPFTNATPKMSHPDYGNTAGISYPSYDKSLCMAATGSRPKRSWDKEDEALLIDLREGHPDKTWIDICEKFNAAVPPLRYRTVDSITGKWKHMHDRCRNEATPKKTKKMEDSSEVWRLGIFAETCA